jgi:hypothetical protein
MRLDNYTTNCLRIAFRITEQGKNGDFWLNLAMARWNQLHGEVEVPPSVWDEVRELLRTEFPQLIERKPRLRKFVESPGTSPTAPHGRCDCGAHA